MSIQIRIDDINKGNFLLLERNEKTIAIEINDYENTNARYVEITTEDFKKALKLFEVINDEKQ